MTCKHCHTKLGYWFSSMHRRGFLMCAAMAFAGPPLPAIAQGLGPIGAGVTIKDTWFHHQNLRQRLWIVTPSGSGPFPAIVWCHGSGVSLTADNNLVDWSAAPQVQGDGLAWRSWSDASKVILIIPECRGYGGSDGEKPIEAFQDSERTVAFLHARTDDTVAATAVALQEYGLDPHRIAIAGASHGAVVALLASARHRYAGTVLQAPGASYRRSDIGMQPMRTAAAEGHEPMLIQHLLTDTLAPIVVSRSIHEAAVGANRPCTLREYPGTPGIEGHELFARENRAQWTADFSEFMSSRFASVR
ncbi:MAG: alpha/beta fold hydrolase [Xanthobacteraceae bacterium]